MQFSCPGGSLSVFPMHQLYTGGWTKGVGPAPVAEASSIAKSSMYLYFPVTMLHAGMVTPT